MCWRWSYETQLTRDGHENIVEMAGIAFLSWACGVPSQRTSCSSGRLIAMVLDPAWRRRACHASIGVRRSRCRAFPFIAAGTAAALETRSMLDNSTDVRSTPFLIRTNE